MTSIKVYREFKDPGLLRKYKIMLAGNIVGKVKVGQTIEIPVKPGIHELYVKVDWSRSRKIKCTIADGERQLFRCCQKANWYNIFQILYYGFFKFNYSIILEKVVDLQEV